MVMVFGPAVVVLPAASPVMDCHTYHAFDGVSGRLVLSQAVWFCYAHAREGYERISR